MSRLSLSLSLIFFVFLILLEIRKNHLGVDLKSADSSWRANSSHSREIRRDSVYELQISGTRDKLAQPAPRD